MAPPLNSDGRLQGLKGKLVFEASGIAMAMP